MDHFERFPKTDRSSASAEAMSQVLGQVPVWGASGQSVIQQLLENEVMPGRGIAGWGMLKGRCFYVFLLEMVLHLSTSASFCFGVFVFVFLAMFDR